MALGGLYGGGGQPIQFPPWVIEMVKKQLAAKQAFMQQQGGAQAGLMGAQRKQIMAPLQAAQRTTQKMAGIGGKSIHQTEADFRQKQALDAFNLMIRAADPGASLQASGMAEGARERRMGMEGASLARVHPQAGAVKRAPEEPVPGAEADTDTAFAEDILGGGEPAMTLSQQQQARRQQMIDSGMYEVDPKTRRLRAKGAAAAPSMTDEGDITNISEEGTGGMTLQMLLPLLKVLLQALAGQQSEGAPESYGQAQPLGMPQQRRLFKG